MSREVVTRYPAAKVRERRIADAKPPAALPLLSLPQREMLMRWARADSLTRQWLPLLRSEESRASIEEVEDLATLLLNHGWISVTDRQGRNGWLRQSITWLHLPLLKQLLGLGTLESRRDQRSEQLQALADWVRPHEALHAAAAELAEGGAALNLATLARRIELLQALARWQDEQQTGTRRDFELQARGKTKSLATAEWQWLDAHVDLPALGIERFAQQVWLAGAFDLMWAPEHRCDLRALHCVGLAARDLLKLVQAASPAQYWLIENRASFERQAAQRADGVALIWLPGRPPGDWMAAVGALLDRAPAPARISADPDPAGVEIALTAGSLWESRGLAWEPHLMGVDQLAAARQKLPLDDHHDPATLARIHARPGVPEALRRLCEHMAQEQVKAEQEGWL
jgi:hypothetical protein